MVLLCFNLSTASYYSCDLVANTDASDASPRCSITSHRLTRIIPGLHSPSANPDVGSDVANAFHGDCGLSPRQVLLHAPSQQSQAIGTIQADINSLMRWSNQRECNEGIWGGSVLLVHWWFDLVQAT